MSLNRVAAHQMICSKFTGDNAFELIRNIIAPALENIGDMWNCGEIALSQEYMASKMCEVIVEDILPSESSSRKNQPILGITTLGDEHMLGKRIVISFLKSCGFDVHDYGDMAPENVVRKIAEDNVQVILVSTLMLNFAHEVKKLRSILESNGSGTKIIVGGAPFMFDPDLWREVGAHAMANDATESLDVICKLMGGNTCVN
ncbi:methylmalonyl-CoA mutase cobalamin-binding domain/chain [Methanolobus bombayensis]|nr:methylmalonyl-CoA mutase cobalamin-binding domain/chain [Methanolobus bombayensis]